MKTCRESYLVLRTLGPFLSLLLLPSLGVPVLGAAGQSFVGAGTGKLLFDFGGSYGDIGKQNAETAQLSTRVTIDPAALNLGYDFFTITSDGFDLSFNQVFTVGPGQSVPVRTDIHVTPFTLTALNNTPYKMVASTGGQYNLVDNGALFYPFPNFNLTGNYSITGPTSSQSGTFSLPFTEGDINSRLNRIIVDANGYPASIKLLEAGYQAGYGNGIFGTDFGGTVDGVNISFDFRGMWLQSNSLNLSAVPEPATLSLVGFVTLAGFDLLRRRK